MSKSYCSCGEVTEYSLKKPLVCAYCGEKFDKSHGSISVKPKAEVLFINQVSESEIPQLTKLELVVEKPRYEIETVGAAIGGSGPIGISRYAPKVPKKGRRAKMDRGAFESQWKQDASAGQRINIGGD